jgi:hypothetical protein
MAVHESALIPDNVEKDEDKAPEPLDYIDLPIKDLPEHPNVNQAGALLAKALYNLSVRMDDDILVRLPHEEYDVEDDTCNAVPVSNRKTGALDESLVMLLDTQEYMVIRFATTHGIDDFCSTPATTEEEIERAFWEAEVLTFSDIIDGIKRLNKQIWDTAIQIEQQSNKLLYDVTSRCDSLTNIE